MSKEIKPPWKEKDDKIVNKDDFLNNMEFEEVSDTQQMLYLMYKEIDILKEKMNELENRIKKLE